MAHFGALITIVEVFNCLLDTDGDAKANDNGGDMYEKVSPSTYWRMDWVHVEQSLLPRRW
jgi:hypothetical protein